MLEILLNTNKKVNKHVELACNCATASLSQKANCSRCFLTRCFLLLINILNREQTSY